MEMTLEGFRGRWAAVGDLTAGIDAAAGDLSGLLAMADADEARGLGDAPWPPHYPKQPGEPPRVQPSKRRRAGAEEPARRASVAQVGVLPPPAFGFPLPGSERSNVALSR